MPRPTKRSADAAQAAAESQYRRSELWNDLVRGDAVRITGIRGGSWRFRCHVVHASAGTSWVEVDELDVPRGVSLTAGRSPAADGDEVRQPAVRRVRAFEEERVVVLGRRRRQRPAAARPGSGAQADAAPPGGAQADAAPPGGAQAPEWPDPDPAAAPGRGGASRGAAGAAVQLSFADSPGPGEPAAGAGSAAATWATSAGPGSR